MEAYVSGDEGAFRRLFGRLAPALHAFFLRSVGERAEAEDLMQTTLLRVHGARDRWRRGERLRPWVFTIAARVRVDWLRRRGRLAEEPIEEEALARPADGLDGEAGGIARERAERVKAALDRLPETARVIVHLHRYEELSFAEIGRSLGMTEGAAKLRAFRAYEQLRAQLADLLDGDPA